MAWAHNNASAACIHWIVACQLGAPSSPTTTQIVRKLHSLSLGRQRPFPSDCSNQSILSLPTSSPQLWTVKISVAHECCPDSFLSKVALLVLVASATGTPCLCRCLSRRPAPGRSFASCHLRESASLLVVSCAAGKWHPDKDNFCLMPPAQKPAGQTPCAAGTTSLVQVMRGQLLRAICHLPKKLCSHIMVVPCCALQAAS